MALHHFAGRALCAATLLALGSAAFFIPARAAGPATAPAQEKNMTIVPGALWKDDRGLPIQAHGGGMLKFQDTCYWFGEDRSPANDRN